MSSPGGTDRRAPGRGCNSSPEAVSEQARPPHRADGHRRHTATRPACRGLGQPRPEEREPDCDSPGNPLEAFEPIGDAGHEGAGRCHGCSRSLASFAARSRPMTSWSAARSSGCLPRHRSSSPVGHDTKRAGSTTSTAAVVARRSGSSSRPRTGPAPASPRRARLPCTAARPDASTSTRPGLAPCGDQHLVRRRRPATGPPPSRRWNSRGVSVRKVAAYSVCSSAASLTGRRSCHSRAIWTTLMVL